MTEISKINYKSLITNRRYLVFSGVIFLIGLMLIFSGIIPQINSLLDLNLKIGAGQEKLSRLRQKTNDLENIEAREAYDSLESVNRILPSKKPLIELLTTLNLIAGKNSVSFVNLSLSPGEIASQSADFLEVAKNGTKGKKTTATVGDGYDTLVVELEISGLFGNVQQFFLDIEQAAPLTTIMSLSLDIKSDDIIRASDEVTAKIVLSTYFFNQSVKANLDSALPSIGTKEREIVDEIKNYSYPTANEQQQIQNGGLEDPFGLTLQDLEK